MVQDNILEIVGFADRLEMEYDRNRRISDYS